MPKLKVTGKYFMFSAEQIEKFDFGLLENVSDYFLYNFNFLKEVYFPNLIEMGNYFMYSDDNVEIYLNGFKVAVTGNGLDYNLLQEIPSEVAGLIKPTGNLLKANKGTER